MLFVDGLGYHDDGEEHLGQALDAYDGKICNLGTAILDLYCIIAKKALLEDAEEEDAKKLKKKAKYMQSNTLFNYAKSSSIFTNNSNTIHTTTSDKASLDIDNLLGNATDAPIISRARHVPVKSQVRKLAPAALSSTLNYAHDDDCTHNSADSDILERTTMDTVIHSSTDNTDIIDHAATDITTIKTEDQVELVEPEAEIKISLSKTKSKMKPLERKANIADGHYFSAHC